MRSRFSRKREAEARSDEMLVGAAKKVSEEAARDESGRIVLAVQELQIAAAKTPACSSCYAAALGGRRRSAELRCASTS